MRGAGRACRVWMYHPHKEQRVGTMILSTLELKKLSSVGNVLVEIYTREGNSYNHLKEFQAEGAQWGGRSTR